MRLLPLRFPRSRGLLFLLLLLAGRAQPELPKEVQLDILQTQVIEKLEAEDWPAFLAKLAELRQLGAEPDHEIKYWEAIANKGLTTPQGTIDAKRLLDEYLSRATKESPGYSSALALYQQYDADAKAALKTLGAAAQRAELARRSPYSDKKERIREIELPNEIQVRQVLAAPHGGVLVLYGQRDSFEIVHAPAAGSSLKRIASFLSRLPPGVVISTKPIGLHVLTAAEAASLGRVRAAPAKKTLSPRPPQAGDIVCAYEYHAPAANHCGLLRYDPVTFALLEDHVPTGVGKIVNSVYGKKGRPVWEAYSMSMNTVITPEAYILAEGRAPKEVTLFSPEGARLATQRFDGIYWRASLFTTGAAVENDHYDGTSKFVIERQGDVLLRHNIGSARRNSFFRVSSGYWLDADFVNSQGSASSPGNSLRALCEDPIEDMRFPSYDSTDGDALVGVISPRNEQQIFCLSAEGKVLWISDDNRIKCSLWNGTVLKRKYPLRLAGDVWFELQEHQTSREADTKTFRTVLRFHHPARAVSL